MALITNDFVIRLSNHPDVRLMGRLELTKLIFTQILSMVENVSFKKYVDYTRIKYMRNGIVSPKLKI